MPAALEERSPYRLKPAPYSSHSLLLAAFPEDGAGRRVLDVGCAAGYLSEALAARGFAVTGVDLPGASHSNSFRFIPADLENGLPPLDQRFDYVLCADILEHLRDPLRLLSDIRRVLAPGGKLIASLPNSGHAYFRWNVLMGRFPQQDKGLFDRTHVRFYTWDGWQELLGRGGFTIEGVRSSGVPVGLALPRWDGTAPVRALERLSYESARLWKRLFAYQFVITARAEEGA